MPKKKVGTGHVVITDESGEEAAAANHADSDIYADDMAPLAKEKAPIKKAKLALKGMVKLELTGAASYGYGKTIYRRDDTIEVDSETADKLLTPGFFVEG